MQTQLKLTPQVHETCFELFQIEMIEMFGYFHSFSFRSQKEELQTEWSAATVSKVEQLGFTVGIRLAERYAKEKGRYTENLDMVKFICKDFWLEVFKKQIDNLRTNHKVKNFLDKERASTNFMIRDFVG